MAGLNAAAKPLASTSPQGGLHDRALSQTFTDFAFDQATKAALGQSFDILIHLHKVKATALLP
ncbi:hypothetical protein [Nonomuraea sp. NPDC048901]|uniref:hypothetical protein n=1 Tax=Nonomuraea sp. NPDC048901 TaxID=3155627 RepID=UPI0033FB0E9F